MNAVEIEEAVSQLAEAPFDAAAFPYQFLEAFGNKATTIKRLRKGSTNKSDVEGGVLQRGHIHLAVAPEGGVADMMQTLRGSEATQKKSNKVTFILATDGKEFEAENLIDAEQLACTYAHFADHFGFFLALAGITTVKEIRENAFDIKATGRLNKLYLELLKHNPDWASDERREDLNHFLARLIFCFFAEDTNIFVDNLFTSRVEQMSERDASNTHEILSELFRAMATPHKKREEVKIANWAKAFPYVNGGLFSGEAETPRFTKIARTYLLGIGRLDWKQVNPDIFGSMIQAVAGDEDRSALGMHYTSVPNILKVLNPLFLDELRVQLEAAGDSSRKLLNLRNRIAHIRVFDPACGSGNFLVIAYKQLREIEAEINKRRGEPELHTHIPITNFRGIEIRHFAAEIARLALVIAKFQADVSHRGENLALSEFLPLATDNWIVCANALRIDWESVCPPFGKTQAKYHADDLFETPLVQPQIGFENEGGEVFICGNPPFCGSVQQTDSQKDDMRYVLSSELKKYKDLDYVSLFSVKAARYNMRLGSTSAFVSTNSICQGEQVGMLWPILFKYNSTIVFAYDSFLWNNLAKNNAGVTCIIVGLNSSDFSEAVLYSGDAIMKVPNLTPYLTPGEKVIVRKRSSPFLGFPQMSKGNQPNDGGHLLLSFSQKREILSNCPEASKYIFNFPGAKEFIRGIQRYCLWINDEDILIASRCEEIRNRLRNVTKVRGDARSEQSKRIAPHPNRFAYAPHKSGPAILLPQVFSERREYMSVGYVSYIDTIISSTATALYEAQLFILAIVSAKIHLTWIATVCGKLKTDYRYSNTLGWNTFPVPKLTTQDKADLTRCAENILLARERYYPATIAHMYDPKRMDEEFPEVRRAHEENDETLERIYIGRRFKNDTERLEVLFKMYEKMVGEEAKN